MIASLLTGEQQLFPSNDMLRLSVEARDVPGASEFGGSGVLMEGLGCSCASSFEDVVSV